MALDWGRRRIGVAVTDPMGVLAQPLQTLEIRSRDEAVRRVEGLVREYEVALLIVGLPLHMGGQEGPEAREAREFGGALEKATGVPVEYLDERWTTVEAERALGEAGVPARRQRAKLDRVAAALLLQTWLGRSAR